jgi:macrolide transport system ATP-binding/permease protein
MKLLHAFFIRLSGLFAPNRQQDRDDELASHLQLNIDDNIRSGMTPDEARRHAIIRLGGIEPTRQAWRERSTLPLVENFLQDLRFALRQLRKNPGFTLTAVLVLSLGIAASTSIFGFVDAALIRPLPYPEPNRLVDVTESIALFPRASISYLDYLDWKRLNNVFASFDVFNSPGFLLRTPRGADLVAGARVSDGFFRTLGISPILGRDFYPGEDLPGKPATVLITYNAWQQRFGGNPKIVGQVIDLSNHPFTVIGVLPQNFEFALRGNAEFWAPLQGTGSCFNRRGCHNLNGVARLKDGVTIDAALTQMRSIAQRLEAQYPGSQRPSALLCHQRRHPALSPYSPRRSKPASPHRLRQRI